LLQVILHDGIQAIREFVFAGCLALSCIVIPPSISTIGNGAFWNCTALVQVELHEGLQRIGIGEYALKECRSLRSITISSSVTSIDCGAFQYCISLEKVVLHEGLTRIGRTFHDQSQPLGKMHFMVV
jgi:hypothetical protein